MTTRRIAVYSKIIILLGLSISTLFNQAQAQVVVVPLGGLEPVARAQVNTSGGVIGSGILSVNASSIGIYIITFKSSIGSAPIVLLSPISASAPQEVLGYTPINSTQITVNVFNGNTGALRNSAFSIMVIRNGS